MAALSEWLELMLAEIARKQDEQRSAEQEQQRRMAALPRDAAPTPGMTAASRGASSQA